MKANVRSRLSRIRIWAHCARGVTLVEMVATISVLFILVTMAMPLARNAVKRHREAELHRALNVMCSAIDRYHRLAQRGAIKPWDPDWEFFPPDLETLVEGVEMNSPGGKPRTEKFLREIPVDPMTGKQEWGQRSYQQDATETTWDGQNLWDVYTLSSGIALDGSNYSDWGCEDTAPNEPGINPRW